MNGKYFTHILLLLAMLVSQMATNAHMIHHMALAAVDCDFAVSHEGHHHGDAALDATDSDNATNDCSIYHAFAGVNGIVPADRNHNDIPSNNVLVKQALSTRLVTRPLISHPIRGPPQIS